MAILRFREIVFPIKDHPNTIEKYVQDLKTFSLKKKHKARYIQFRNFSHVLPVCAKIRNYWLKEQTTLKIA